MSALERLGGISCTPVCIPAESSLSPAAKFGQQSHFPVSSAGRSSISSSEEALYRNFATCAAADTTISIHEDMYNSE